MDDLRFAIRQIFRAPGFSVAAALTLALGIGANTAVFSVINGYTRPLPVPDPDRIVIVASRRPDDETGIRFKFSFQALQDYRAQTTVFTDVFAFDLRLDGIGIDGETSQFLHQAVTGNFFSGLGLTPAAGRFFQPGEGETPNAEPLLVLGHAFWQRRFGGSPAVIGTSVRLNGQPARVIGVTPHGFDGLVEGAAVDGYTPIGLERSDDLRPGQYLTDRAVRLLTMVARLRPGVTIDQAQAEVDVIARGLAARHPDTEKDNTAQVFPEPIARPFPIPFLTDLLPLIRALLLLLTSMVLLIACLNVANLMLVRASGRQSELAVRAALGAGRRRLIRLLLTESCLLAIAGAVAGLLIGKIVSIAFASSIDIGTDFFRVDFEFDRRVFAFTLLTAVATGLVAGVLPAIRASRADVTDLLGDGGRLGSAGASRQRVRSLLVVCQVAGSVALLVVAGLIVRSLQGIQRLDVGFDAEQVITLRLDTTHAGYDTNRSAAFYDDLIQRIEEWPGVESVSTSFTLPLSYLLAGAAAHPEGQSGVRTEATSVGYNSVTPDYFRTLRIPIVKGRGFTDRDTEGTARVAVVNQTLAARFWPSEDPLGKRIDIPHLGGAAWEVVGVVPDGKYITVFEWPLPHFYVPQTQNASRLRTLAVRSDIPFADLGLRLRREITALAPDLPVADLQPLSELVEKNFGFVLFRVGVWQATAMGLVGVVLAIVGVYGVVSYRTQQRSREIGIRMALGAIPSDVRALVLRQAGWLVTAGVLAGLVVSAGLGGILRRVLISVSALDPVTFSAVTIFVGATAIAACYIPARRAMRMDPASVLRRE